MKYQKYTCFRTLRNSAEAPHSDELEAHFPFAKFPVHTFPACEAAKKAVKTVGEIVEGNRGADSSETADYTRWAIAVTDNQTTERKQDEFVVGNQEIEKKLVVVADLQNIVYSLDFVAAPLVSFVASAAVAPVVEKLLAANLC
jgi:hypothetical protein